MIEIEDCIEIGRADIPDDVYQCEMKHYWRVRFSNGFTMFIGSGSPSYSFDKEDLSYPFNQAKELLFNAADYQEHLHEEFNIYLAYKYCVKAMDYYRTNQDLIEEILKEED